jgi:hypothetical protein
LANNYENISPVSFEELLIILIHFKNKNTPGSDGINIIVIKHIPVVLLIRQLGLINLCWRRGYIPDE